MCGSSARDVSRSLPWSRFGKVGGKIGDCVADLVEDVEQHLLALSTYLGHAALWDTYWYLTAIPELLEFAGTRFEHFTKPRSGDTT